MKSWQALLVWVSVALSAGTAAASMGDLHIAAPAAAVRVGDTLTLSLEVEELLGTRPAEPEGDCVWTATAGTITGTGPTVTYTPPATPGYIALTATCNESGGPSLTAKRALLVYKQFVIIKADDLLSYDGTVSAAWQQYFDYMSETRRIKHSAGIITESLSFYSLAGANNYTGLVRAHHDSGLAEFFHHGLDHSGSPVEARLLDAPTEWVAPLSAAPLTEFFGQPYAYQKAHLEDGLAYSRAVLGFPMHTFGAPFGLTDTTTLQVIDESTDIKVWFDGQLASTKRVIDVNELLVENPTGYPILAQFQAVYDPEEPLIVLQVHPGYTEEPGSITPFIDRFPAWATILDLVEAEDATFILPYEYHQLFDSGEFPLHPDVDSDGDGYTDRDEGAGDDNSDGLPDFMDPLSDGAADPRVRNITVQPNGDGTYDIDFKFLGTGILPRTFAVALEDTNGQRTSLAEITGLLPGIPGLPYSFEWDARAELGDIEQDGAAIIITPSYNPLPIHDLVTVPAATFTQGCPDCDTGDSQPRFDATLDDYYIGKYEVTNAEYATVLNGVYLTGAVGDANGDPYTGGDVYLAGQLILEESEDECGIEFNSGVFSVKTRDAISLANHPVTHVTWYGAVLYCHALSILEGLAPAYELGGTWALKYPYTNGYRLPTEAEWERAAAWGGGAPAFTYAIASNTLDPARANYDSANPIAFTDAPYTTPAGYYNGDNSTTDSPSPTGTYDMSGNVAEWVHDRYAPYAVQDDPLKNPRGSDTRAKRVIRGGHWSSPPGELEAARRVASFANRADDKTGFRIARTVTVGVGRSAPFRVDTLAPTLDLALVGTPAEDAPEVTWQITFSEPVTGVTQDLFSLATTGDIESAPAITSFTGSGTAYTLTADTGFMQGTLTLEFNDANGDVTDLTGNPLDTATAAATPATINTIQPRVDSITLVGTPAANAATVQFLIQFNKPVSDLALDDLSLLEQDRIGDTPTLTAVETTGAQATVTLTLGATEGRYGIAINDADSSILGAGGYSLRDTTVESGLLHTADTRGALATLALSGSPAPNAATLTLALQFSEPVTGLSLTNFTLATEGTITDAPALTDLDGTGDTYTLTLDTGTLDALITLDWLNTATILDAAGNPLLDTGGPLALPAIDTIAPELESFELTQGIAPNSRNVPFLLTFSEPIYDFTAAEFTPVASGVIETDPSILTVERATGFDTLTVAVDPGAFTGTLFLQFFPDTIRDAAGNPVLLDALSPVSHPTDTVPPRLTSVEPVTPSPTNAASIQFRLSFSEPVSGLTTGDISAALDITSAPLTFTTATGAFDGNLSTVLATLSGLSSGSATLTLSAAANGLIRDQNDNPLDTVTVPAASITIDRTPPQPRCVPAFIDLDETGLATAQPTAFDDGSTDDTGTATAIAVTPADFTCDTPGLRTVTVTFQDTLGNTADCTTFAIVRNPLDACRPPDGEGEGEATSEGEGGGEGDGEAINEGEGEAAPDGEGGGEGEGIREGEGEGSAPTHAGDWNGAPDNRLDLTELLRVIQLYNAGAVCCDTSQTTEDGYLPEPCEAHLCPRHTGDYAEPAWQLTLSEILRIIQLFNLGPFRPCPEGESEDGFCPGAP